MIITKRTLVESVQDRPMTTPRMDVEFYSDATVNVWADIQNLINHIIKGDKTHRNQWAFDSDLNADQMRWLEHHPETVTVAMVKQRYTDKQVYDMIKGYKLNTPQEIQNLASYLLGESIPKL